MHKEILSENQEKLLPLLKLFSKEYYLVGGTAIALYIGHRRSIDFDLFSDKNIKRRAIKAIIEENNYPCKDIIFEAFDQMHLIIDSVRLTFFSFPYRIDANTNFEGVINMPSLLDLAAMKSYALGGRAKWKDYVDLYFILKDYYSLQEISGRAKEIFQDFFNQKLFREQLSYFDDIDYSEKIEYVKNEVVDDEIKNFLISIATEPL